MGESILEQFMGFVRKRTLFKSCFLFQSIYENRMKSEQDVLKQIVCIEEMEERLMGHMIQLNHVKKQYGNDKNTFYAVNDISLSIKEGEFVAIVGKSGSGKSTLLNIMSGIDEASEGEVKIKERDIKHFSQKDMISFRGKHIGIVFQFFQLMPTLTVLENVVMPMDFVGYLDKKQRYIRAKELLKKVGMEKHCDKLPGSLSGGEQQRVAIARALANDPDMIFADEPTGNLDSKTTEDIFRLLVQLSEEGKSIIMVTHNGELAMRCPRRICISDGKITEDVSKESKGE